ncbi:hypothetical protein [Desmonostoc muscorum]|nr:hypothetical protein [Desmonostoc muscorum]
MIDDISLSTAIINNPQIEVHFNTTPQELVIIRRGIEHLIDNPD